VTHLNATCFVHPAEWPLEPVWPPVSACGEAGPVTITIEGVTCPLCLVRFDESAAAGLVDLVPYGHGHEVVCQLRSR
jgi:hypothetical protein